MGSWFDSQPPKTGLNEYDKEEWWDVARRVTAGRNPPYTREQYEKDWEEFLRLKLEHERRKVLQ